MTHITDYIDHVSHDERVHLAPSTREEMVAKVKYYIFELIVKEKENND
jgi:hypothetical protein